MFRNIARKIGNALRKLGDIFPPDEKFLAICDYHGRTGLLHKSQADKKDWIPFNSLVNPDNSFNPCPKCGGKVGCRVHGSAITPIISKPHCASCGCSFTEEERDSKKGFKMATPLIG